LGDVGDAMRGVGGPATHERTWVASAPRKDEDGMAMASVDAGVAMEESVGPERTELSVLSAPREVRLAKAKCCFGVTIGRVGEAGAARGAVTQSAGGAGR
jgi:hypothetical protein